MAETRTGERLPVHSCTTGGMHNQPCPACSRNFAATGDRFLTPEDAAVLKEHAPYDATAAERVELWDAIHAYARASYTGAERGPSSARMTAVSRVTRAVEDGMFALLLREQRSEPGPGIRASERQRIVAYLREQADEAEKIPGPPQYEDALRNAADAIEDGEHWKSDEQRRAERQETSGGNAATGPEPGALPSTDTTPARGPEEAGATSQRGSEPPLFYLFDPVVVGYGMGNAGKVGKVSAIEPSGLHVVTDAQGAYLGRYYAKNLISLDEQRGQSPTFTLRETLVISKAFSLADAASAYVADESSGDETYQAMVEAAHAYERAKNRCAEPKSEEKTP